MNITFKTAKNIKKGDVILLMGITALVQDIQRISEVSYKVYFGQSFQIFNRYDRISVLN